MIKSRFGAFRLYCPIVDPDSTDFVALLGVPESINSLVYEFTP
jgi:hypothetical protein